MLLPPNVQSFVETLKDNDDFFVEYLLRVYWILNSQLPLWARILGPGVADVPDATSLQVTKVGANYLVAPGIGAALSASFGVVPMCLLEATPATGLTPGETNYIYCAAVFDLDPSDDADADADAAGPDPDALTLRDTRLDGRGEVVVSKDAEIDGAVRLAEITPEGLVIDARQYLSLTRCLRRLDAIDEILGYGPSTFADKGSIETRLNALLAPVGEGDSVGLAQILARLLAVEERNLVQDELIAALAARIGAPGLTSQVDDIDRHLVRDVGRLEVEAALNNPKFSLETDASLFVPGKFGNGESLGDGLTARDVHSGNTILDPVEGSES